MYTTVLEVLQEAYFIKWEAFLLGQTGRLKHIYHTFQTLFVVVLSTCVMIRYTSKLSLPALSISDRPKVWNLSIISSTTSSSTSKSTPT